MGKKAYLCAKKQPCWNLGLKDGDRDLYLVLTIHGPAIIHQNSFMQLRWIDHYNF